MALKLCIKPIHVFLFQMTRMTSVLKLCVRITVNVTSMHLGQLFARKS